jgi:hypothetical protein
MEAKQVISHIPLKQVFRLIADLLKFAKAGINADERAQLLEDLAQIALAVAQDVAS